MRLPTIQTVRLLITKPTPDLRELTVGYDVDFTQQEINSNLRYHEYIQLRGDLNINDVWIYNAPPSAFNVSATGTLRRERVFQVSRDILHPDWLRDKVHVRVKVIAAFDISDENCSNEVSWC